MNPFIQNAPENLIGNINENKHGNDKNILLAVFYFCSRKDVNTLIYILFIFCRKSSNLLLTLLLGGLASC